MDKRNTPKLYEIIVLTLPALSLAGLGLLVHVSGYHIHNPSDAFGFIKEATLFRRPRDYFVILLTFPEALAVVAILVLFL